MSGCMAAAAAAGGGNIVSGTYSPNMSSVSASTGIRTVTMTVARDGTLSYTGGGAAQNWVIPGFAAIGDSWQVRFSLSGGSNYTVSSGTTGTFQALSAAKAISLQNTGISLLGVGTLTMAFSRDGVNIAGSNSITFEVGKTA